MNLIEPPDGIFHHEDLRVGSDVTFGAREVTRAEIIAFASAYDPQPIHLDDAAAKASIVGGLCASGFHSCALMMRLLCDHFLLRSASLGSPGVDEVRWLKPVRPGDRLSIRIKVLDARLLHSLPDVGLARVSFELLDQTNAPVLLATTNQLTRRRHPGPALPERERKQKTAVAATANLWDEMAVDAPVRGNYFEDQVLGEVRDLDSHTFAADEIVAFAQQFDPQPFHLDEAAGKRSLFGGLAASGWHTAAHFIRQTVRARQAQEAVLRASGATLAAWGPSPGFRDLRWLKPVLAGDTIAFRSKIAEKRDLKSRPSHGLLISQAEGRNQRGDIVYKFTGQMFVERRAPAAS